MINSSLKNISNIWQHWPIKGCLKHSWAGLSCLGWLLFLVAFLCSFSFLLGCFLVCWAADLFRDQPQSLCVMQIITISINWMIYLRTPCCLFGARAHARTTLATINEFIKLNTSYLANYHKKLHILLLLFSYLIYSNWANALIK